MAEKQKQLKKLFLHDQEICFHTLSAIVAQKAAEKIWVKFYSQRGGGSQVALRVWEMTRTFRSEIIYY